MSILGIAFVLLQVQLAGVAGMVVKPSGNEPLSRATVTLAPVAPGENVRPHSAVTEEDGRFTIRDIEPGDYRLVAESVRYGHAAYGQRKPGGPGSILSIAAGQQLSGLRLSMIPTGAIAGRVTGLNGEPLVSATVQAFRYVYEEGRKVQKIAQSTTTDDRGAYRLFWLPAGQYFVAAAKGSGPGGPNAAPPIRPGASGSSASYLVVQTEMQLAALLQSETSGAATLRILEDGTTREEAWAPVYYPGTMEPGSATALDLAAGTTRNGVDMVIGPARVLSVRGRAVGFTPGSVATVNLIPQDTTSAVRTPLFGKGASTRDGSFVFTGVLSGDYIVVAGDSRTGLVGSPLPVHVGDRDVENVILGMTPAVRVSGRILIEGVPADAGGVNPLTRVSVALIPNNNLPTLQPIPQIVAGSDLLVLNTPIDIKTGSFTVTNLAPGDYQIQIGGAARLYLKSARLGLTDILGGVHIAGNTNDRLEIVLTADPGSVEGVAIGSRSGPAANATVVLVPNVARKLSNLYRSVVTGADGRFRFQDLAPGDYKLFAWDDVETGAWQDPDFIRLYESKGLLVHISEKGREDVQLNVIYNP